MTNFYMPTRAEVASLKAGDLIINPFGKPARVTRIHARGEDIHGKLYACYYVEWGEGSTISDSIKEGELLRTVAVSRDYTSAQLDAIERTMRKERGL
jgi:hypothetical protein